jgi:hypothetical protein
MCDAFDALWSRIPFAICQIHSDNGPEFINDLIFSFLQTRNIAFSRSRPYRKNDNRFVEENNGSLIRAFVGYARFDSFAQLQALNALYDVLTLYHNLFQPVMRRQEDRSYTVSAPLDRLLSANVWDQTTAQAWRSYRDNLDPLALRIAIADALNALEKALAAQDGQTVDVRQTLGLWKTGTTLRSASACPPFPTASTTTTTMPLSS